MKAKSFSVSAADLNTHAVQKVSTVITLSQTGASGMSADIDYFPKKIQIINRTGIDVKVNILSSAAEEAAYDADPTNYDLWTILNNTSQTWTSISILPLAYKILVQAPTGTATAALEIECIGYQPK